ncbi:hypothetical protein Tco_0344185 [Tanacetum coccineum]
MRVNILDFAGDTLSPEGFIDWLVAVEDVLENKRVSLIATKLHDYTTEFYQLIARNDIQETEDQLVSRYIGSLRVQIMESVNMFDPMTLSDAQRASGLGNVASCFAPSKAKACGGNTGPVPRASDDDAAYEEYEESPVYDEQPECEEYVSGVVGVNLVVRRSCLTPKADGDDWLKRNIF